MEYLMTDDEFHKITWLNQWRTITDHGGTTPDQCSTCTKVIFRTEFKSDFKLYTPHSCHLSCSLALLHQLTYFCVVIVAFDISLQNNDNAICLAW